jgi:hypothetical protein
MLPQSVRIATIVIAVNALFWNVLIPLGGLALNAVHPESVGESPLLSFVAAPVFFLISLPVLLIAALFYFKLRDGRNWARIAYTIFVALIVTRLVSDFRIANLMHAGHWGVAEITSFTLYAVPYSAAYIVAVVLLFSATANAWFAAEGGHSAP